VPPFAAALRANRKKVDITTLAASLACRSCTVQRAPRWDFRLRLIFSANTKRRWEAMRKLSGRDSRANVPCGAISGAKNGVHGTKTKASSRFFRGIGAPAHLENPCFRTGSAGSNDAREKRAGKLFHVEQFGVNGTGLENFVVSGFVLWSLQLRKIMAICALLQRMGIFGAERENSRKFRAPGDFGSAFGANFNSRSSGRNSETRYWGASVVGFRPSHASQEEPRVDRHPDADSARDH